MDDETSTTSMIRWECYACGQEATCVATDAANEAWAHHMAAHLDSSYYGCWEWTVVQLFPACGDDAWANCDPRCQGRDDCVIATTCKAI